MSTIELVITIVETMGGFLLALLIREKLWRRADEKRLRRSPPWLRQIMEAEGRAERAKIAAQNQKDNRFVIRYGVILVMVILVLLALASLSR